MSAELIRAGFLCPVQENQSLANRLQSVEVNNEIKSMQEELSVLDDVRDGKLCSRCLRSCHAIGHDLGDLERLQHGDDDMQSYGGTEDGDDSSLMELNSWDVPTYTSTAQLTVSVAWVEIGNDRDHLCV